MAHSKYLLDGRVDGGREGDGWVGGQMFGWMDEKGDEWLDGWVSG
jgi:hypothetical protein